MQISINQKLDLQITMTQQLSQSIELLQMSSEELENFLREQQMENPLIKLPEPITYKERVFRNNFNSIDVTSLNLKDEISPIDELLQNLRLSVKNKSDMQLINKITLNLNEKGYLPNALQIMTQGEYDYVLDILINNGYIGVAALNLEHCLSLQAKYHYPNENVLLGIIENLESIANRKWLKLMKQLQITKDELKISLEKIKQLNPHPLPLQSTKVNIIHPDIIVEIDSDCISYSLSDWFCPSISSQKIENNFLSKQERKQMSHWKNETRWIKQALEQRKATILAIMNFLIEYQHDAFIKGLNYVKPLTLKEVAEVIDRHESTVSRATMHKYIQAPWGVFLIKDLFSSKVSTSIGEDFSKEKVKYLLKQLINNENKKKPLSDQKLLELICSQENLELSRRTIAKYREELQISSSSKRKEL